MPWRTIRLVHKAAKLWGGMYVPAGNVSSQSSSKKIPAPSAGCHCHVKSPQRQEVHNGRLRKPMSTEKRVNANRAKKNFLRRAEVDHVG